MAEGPPQAEGDGGRGAPGIGARLGRLAPRLRGLAAGGSGPAVARAFHGALALVYLGAFVSLGVQIHVLIGSRGILPLVALLEQLQERPELGWLDFPTLLWLAPGDTAIGVGIGAGVVLSLAALAGLWPRACFALLVPLYLSYAVACRDLLGFQWDGLLLECGLLAVFLPRERPASWIHFLLRVLLFKLYFESGIAKWQSPLGDWHDGSAMVSYYETAPIPTALAWYAHHLPEWWHHLESRATLVLELLVPLLIFGPRRARLVALVSFSGFQLLNMATANYGFFCWNALALHLFLLDDRDLRWARLGWLSAGFARRGAAPEGWAAPGGWMVGRRVGAGVFVAFFLVASGVEAGRSFGEWSWLDHARPLRAVYAPFRLINVYHLFGHVTRERYEPELQTFDGERWWPRDLRYKPGRLERPPPFVAPHQPRVDFQLWFFGLQHRRPAPAYVIGVLNRLCNDPEAVQSLFAEPLPSAPEGVRIVVSRYQFTTPEERAESGAVWKRRWVSRSAEIRCRETPPADERQAPPSGAAPAGGLRPPIPDQGGSAPS